MDELQGTNIQIILHIKEGLGFGFLKTSFIVSGSLNGYMLETDPAVPCHAPVFDAELVWEADKRRFRSLRVQNVPIKVEVYTMGTQGRKDKVGYLLLSLLSAQPRPSNKIVETKHVWHRLLGVRAEGKCCHPQLLMSLSVEDRINTLTPRNELRMFHSNEIAFPSTQTPTNPPNGRSVLMTINEYLMESKRTATSPDLQPKLICEEGLIQVGNGKHLFVLSFVIGAVENLDLLWKEPIRTCNESVDCYVTYSVFTHDIMTDRVSAQVGAHGHSAHFNQRTSLRISSSLSLLARYFAECPHLVVRVCAGDKEIGICSLDLRKLVPTEDLQHFFAEFCNSDRSLNISERCFILRMEEVSRGGDGRRPYVDVEMALKYVKENVDNKKPNILSARSAANLESARNSERILENPSVDHLRSGSCTHLERDVASVAYTNIAASNTARYKNASGDSVLPTNEIADLIKKMYESFAQSQERLMSLGRTHTSDVQVQCDGEEIARNAEKSGVAVSGKETDEEHVEKNPPKMETRKNEADMIQREKDVVKMAIPLSERDAIMQRFIDELEDWKEKQQELFKCQLKRKEDYHLDLLAEEWAKRRTELECKLRRGVEQCRTLAEDLSRATDDFRLRGYRNTEREKKLLEAKKALEAHYTSKYQELRDASQKMEDDMNHRLKIKDMRIEELEVKMQHLERQVDSLKNKSKPVPSRLLPADSPAKNSLSRSRRTANELAVHLVLGDFRRPWPTDTLEEYSNDLKNNEKEAESKYSGLTKDQTASLIQELRYLEEKLDSAVQSKSFFKEQWGRAVRELHLMKLNTRKQMLVQLQNERRQLGEMRLDAVDERNGSQQSEISMQKSKDDFYVDILANTPDLDTHSIIGRDGLGMFQENNNAPKNPTNERLNELISQRDLLVQQENPDEELIKRLNHDIRNMLLNCAV